MMSLAEERHELEILRLEQAISKTTSQYLIRDYKKAIKRLKKELSIYRKLYYTK